MDKNSIKRFAQYARSKLIPEMEKLVEMWDKATVVSGGINVAGDILNDKPYLHYGKAHESLKREITRKGKKELAEQAAYIWFNRIVALRYMEMHNYLPTRSSFFESSDGSGSPDIVTRALDEYQTTGIDKETVFDLYGKKNKELYAQLFISMCNKLSNEYGFMFGKLDDWTSLLFPMSLLDTNGIIKDDTNGLLSISDENRDEVEIIGWVYQYYISEQKDQYFEDAKNPKIKRKFGKKELGAVTQLFTPKWIVKYMVQNTVGKTWLQNYPDLELQKKWEFYIEGESKEHIDITNPTELTLLDPACGSGHILVVGFEVLYEIYKKHGYSPKQIPQKIIENNLYGFEIDERAHQLACFAVLMKAKQYDEDIQNKVDITNHIICIGENNNFEKVDETKYPNLRSFIELWRNGKIYGSLMKMDEVEIDEEKILSEFNAFEKERGLLDYVISEEELKKLIHQYNLMHNQYVCVVANPPYMGNRNMDNVISIYLKENYNLYKEDLFAACSVKFIDYTKHLGKIGLVTPFVWMSIKAYEELRYFILNNCYISTLVKPSYTAFFESAIVPLNSFCLEKHSAITSGYYFDLGYLGSADSQEPKFLMGINNTDLEYVYKKDQNHFKEIKGWPIAYSLSDQFLKIYRNSPGLGEKSIVRFGMKTGDNQKFLRFRREIDVTKTSFNISDINDTEIDKLKRFPYNKGGERRRWYGNDEYVVNWANRGYYIFQLANDEKRSTGDYPDELKFKEFVSWSLISSSEPSFRIKNNCLSDMAGMIIFNQDRNILRYILALCNSKVSLNFLGILSPTMNLPAGDVSRLPIVIKEEEKVINKADENILFSKEDWDSYEESRNFRQHPFLKYSLSGNLSDVYNKWDYESLNRFNSIKSNEEDLNKIFINIYGLENELSYEEEDKDVTVRKAERENDSKSLISYIIGCMLGRYSLDQEGLIYAGGKFDPSKYKTFEADDDGILPVLYDSYFEDDVVDCTKEFIKKVWGDEKFDENWVWLAQSIDEGSSKSADEIIRNYYNKSFMEDHFNTYKKRPIYRYFVSNSKKPKESAFKCVVYLHRYNKDTISIIRSKYLYKFQSKLEEELARLSKEDTRTAEKRCEEIRKQLIELGDYDKLLKDFADKNIELDLDDGVKVNYTKLMDAGIVAKLKI